MIEIMEGLPDNVLGVVVKGRVSKKDCSDVLLPALERRLEWHHRLRLYYEIRSRYPGAAWEEINLGLEHGAMWERIGLVTDVAWVRHIVQALRLLIPGEIRVFSSNQIPEGLGWVVGKPAKGRGRATTRVVLPSVSGQARPIQPAPQYLHQALGS